MDYFFHSHVWLEMVVDLQGYIVDGHCRTTFCNLQSWQRIVQYINDQFEKYAGMNKIGQTWFNIYKPYVPLAGMTKMMVQIGVQIISNPQKPHHLASKKAYWAIRMPRRCERGIVEEVGPWWTRRTVGPRDKPMWRKPMGFQPLKMIYKYPVVRKRS